MPQTSNGDIAKDLLNGIGLTLLLFVVASYLPLLGFFCALFVPLPMLFYRLKLARRKAALIPAVALGVMMIVHKGASVDILFFGGLMLLGFIMAEFFEMNLSLEKTVALAVAVVLSGGFLGLLFYSNVTRTGIYVLVSAYVQVHLDLALELYKSMGMSSEGIDLVSASLPRIHYILVRIMPAMAIIALLFVTWTNLLVSKSLLTKKGLSYPNFGTLTHWKAPDVLVWLVVGCGLMLLLPAKAFKLLGLNGLLIMMIVYFFQGIAIVAFFFEKKRFPNLIRLILYSLIALQQIVLLLVIGLGFFDVWLDFRKRKTHKSK